VIGFLRLIGALNAAVWLGGAVFFTIPARSALYSNEMSRLLQPKYFPYYSTAIEHIQAAGYYSFVMTCAVIAFLHVLGEWLYFGRPSRKVSFTVVSGLLFLALIGGKIVQPNLSRLHTERYSAALSPADRAAADGSFRRWRMASEILNILIIGGVAVHLWRVANPSDNTRFISSVKFRG